MLGRIAVLASGGGTNLQAILDACARGDIPGEVVCVVYDRKKAYARVRAEQAGVPARYINKLQFDSPEAHDAALLALSLIHILIVKIADMIFEYSIRNKLNEDIPVYSVTNEKGFCTGYFLSLIHI